MNRRPVIGVAWPKDDYLRALEQAGAAPHLLTPDTPPLPQALDSIDGVLLTGGADVDPQHYGDPERHSTLKLDPARDDYELALARAAMARQLPVLAICRGVQLLNVAGGGTLFQDLPSQRPSHVNHRIAEPPDEIVHAVTISAGSRLSSLLEHVLTQQVNSRHHQAVRTPAPGFDVVAIAEDGVVEGIEKPGPAFCVGVQWHPENFWKSGRFASLFEGFVEAARQSALSRQHRSGTDLR